MEDFVARDASTSHLCYLQDVSEAISGISKNQMFNISSSPQSDSKYPELEHWNTFEERAAMIALRQLTTSVEFAWTCCALLQIVPSEAAVERTFSAQKLVESNLRNRSNDKTVMSEMAIKFNHKALQNASLHSVDVVYELNEDNGSDDGEYCSDFDDAKNSANDEQYMDAD